ncbi:Oidioi.mRNA.OKI2018_I69.chr2.g4409.t1.cds [Oikopleura dioica]|uniref:Fibroblast growth factor n=1 Tax=Oikopleura dioica TaxID=34765 RepID=A0ABN7T6B6_OIKDI|nr:Oidioi.mRNA.OKI2018_I69.chr2.g4409.t1.cds [Oikopleura dioica]
MKKGTKLVKALTETFEMPDLQEQHPIGCMGLINNQAVMIAGLSSASVEVFSVSGWCHEQPQPAGAIRYHSCVTLSDGILTLGGYVSSDIKDVYLLRDEKWSVVGQLQNSFHFIDIEYNYSRARLRQLYCKTGFHLEILPDGTIRGTREPESRYSIMEFKVMAYQVVSIQSVYTGLYLSMTASGEIVGTKELTKNGLFAESLSRNLFNTYTSISNYKSRTCRLAIARSGRARNGCKTRARQKSSQFLPRPLDHRLRKYLIARGSTA